MVISPLQIKRVTWLPRQNGTNLCPSLICIPILCLHDHIRIISNLRFYQQYQLHLCLLYSLATLPYLQLVLTINGITNSRIQFELVRGGCRMAEQSQLYQSYGSFRSHQAYGSTITVSTMLGLTSQHLRYLNLFSFRQNNYL